MKLKKHEVIFKYLPVEQIARDDEQPRKNYGEESEKSFNRLLKSIDEYGIEDPLKVMVLEEKRYLTMDGHRRHKCATKLGLKVVPCFIYPKMSPGEFEARRYEVQNNRRSWKPFEKSNALHRIKTTLGLRTNRELSELVHLSITVVSNSLQVREQKVEYLDLMAKYDLGESYKIEFVHLKPKLRKIRNFETDEIIKILFEKVKNDVIRSSRDFRKLGKIFSRATANEEELHRFLSDPDMTVSVLDQRTIQSGFSLIIEQALQQVVAKRKNGVAFSTKELGILKQFHNLLAKII